MSVEQRIDDLIRVGWGVLESDFDPEPFSSGGEALSIASTRCLGRIMFTPDISKISFDKAGKRTFLLPAAY